MFRILGYMQKRMTIYLPLTMVLAIIYGNNFNPGPLRVLMPFIIFFMVYPMMVSLEYSELLARDNQKLQIIAQLINFIIFPFMGYALGRFFFPDNHFIVIGILLMSLLPTSGMTISWTGFAKGNVAAAIKMMILGLILGSILTPFYLSFLMGESAGIPFTDIINEIIKVVFIPMGLAYASQRYLIKRHGEDKFQKEFKKKIPLLANAALYGIVFISTAMRARVIVADPSMLVRILLLLIIFYSISFLLVTIIARLVFNREDGIALVYGTVMRNLSIALAIALSIFSEAGSEVALIVGVAFIVQIQGAAIYLKFIGKIYRDRELASEPGTQLENRSKSLQAKQENI